MTIPITSVLRCCALALVCICASGAVHAADWRQARVHGVTRLSEVDSSVNLDCAPVRAGQPDRKVLVVSFQVGKARRWRAFDVPADGGFAVGDEVVVNLTECHVVRVSEPSEAPAPAP